MSASYYVKQFFLTALLENQEAECTKKKTEVELKDDEDKKQAEEDSATSRKRPRGSDMACKEGRISGERILMDVAWEVGDKWEELGVVLGLEYKVLQSVVGSQVGKPGHMKAFYMLCEWKSRSGSRATYATLVEALEESGLNSCAEKYCYKNP